MGTGTRATNISGGDWPSIYLGHLCSSKTAKLKACSYSTVSLLLVLMSREAGAEMQVIKVKSGLSFRVSSWDSAPLLVLASRKVSGLQSRAEIWKLLSLELSQLAITL